MTVLVCMRENDVFGAPVIGETGIERDPTFASAVFLSLGSDRNRWFQTTYGHNFGSRLYLLKRAKITTETLRLAEQYADEALAWMVEDKVATAVTSIATRSEADRDRVQLVIEITLLDGSKWETRYDAT